MTARGRRYRTKFKPSKRCLQRIHTFNSDQGSLKKQLFEVFVTEHKSSDPAPRFKELITKELFN